MLETVASVARTGILRTRRCENCGSARSHPQEFVLHVSVRAKIYHFPSRLRCRGPGQFTPPRCGGWLGAGLQNGNYAIAWWQGAEIGQNSVQTVIISLFTIPAWVLNVCQTSAFSKYSRLVVNSWSYFFCPIRHGGVLWCDGGWLVAGFRYSVQLEVQWSILLDFICGGHDIYQSKWRQLHVHAIPGSELCPRANGVVIVVQGLANLLHHSCMWYRYDYAWWHWS